MQEVIQITQQRTYVLLLISTILFSFAFAIFTTVSGEFMVEFNNILLTSIGLVTATLVFIYNHNITSIYSFGYSMGIPFHKKTTMLIIIMFSAALIYSLNYVTHVINFVNTDFARAIAKSSMSGNFIWIIIGFIGVLFCYFVLLALGIFTLFMIVIVLHLWIKKD